MKNILYLIVCCFVLASCSPKQKNAYRDTYIPKTEQKPTAIPEKENILVFILAGQSNMAGRGIVEPIDTIPSPRILTINRNGEIILAKEPLSVYEWKLNNRGTSCGLSFAKELLTHIPEKYSILLLPTAVGGTSINQWIGDSIHREVKLLSNFKAKAELGMKYGTVKAILWHQGESDANAVGIMNRQDNLNTLFTKFRSYVNNPTLPILIGNLGSFSKDPDNWNKINEQNAHYAAKDKYVRVVPTNDLTPNRDKIHFDSKSQREMGKRFAKQYLNLQPEFN
jgi:hypothetical protein